MSDPTLGTVVGPFTITEALLTNGGMSLVFAATVNQTQTTTEAFPDKVALKIARVLPLDQMDSAEQTFYFEALNNEVETLRRVRHPNIVRVFPIPRGLPRNPYTARAAELDGSPWYCVMEYLGGGSLEERIQKHGTLPLAEALEVAYQIGLALDHLHSKGMAHLDLKPANVLFRQPVTENWRAGIFQPVLIDFGIAAKMSKAGPNAGSVAFMPPERIRLMRGELAPEQYGDQTKADVYGLGVLLYRMLTGKLPFDGLPRDELTEAILKTKPRPIKEFNADLPDKIEEIVMSALAKDPELRPRVEEMITRLDESAVARPPAPTGVRHAIAATRLPTPTLLSISGVVGLFMAMCFVVSFMFGYLTNDSAQTLRTPVPTLITTEFLISTPTPQARTATPTLPASPTPLPPTATFTPVR